MQPTFSEFEQENAQSGRDALDLSGVQLQRNQKCVEVTFKCSLGGVQWVLLYTHNDLMQKTSNDLDVHLIVVQVENDAVVALILKVSGKFNSNFMNVCLEKSLQVICTTQVLPRICIIKYHHNGRDF